MKPILLFVLLLLPGIHLSAQDQLVLESEYLNQPDTVWVFTPGNYDSIPGNEFPLVYLLHGWSGNYRQWDEIMDCQAYADNYGFIIVCPDGLYDSWYLNSPVETENRYEDFFLEELMPLISKTYRCRENDIFITGLSMGGHGALYLYVQNPSLFKCAGSLSGLLDLNSWRDYYGITRILGLTGTDHDEQVLRAYSVAGKAGNIKSAGKEIMLSCGTEDPFYGINIEFITACKKMDIPVHFIETPGAHNMDYWRSAIGAQFDFFMGMAWEEK